MSTWEGETGVGREGTGGISLCFHVRSVDGRRSSEEGVVRPREVVGRIGRAGMGRLGDSTFCVLRGRPRLAGVLAGTGSAGTSHSSASSSL